MCFSSSSGDAACGSTIHTPSRFVTVTETGMHWLDVNVLGCSPGQRRKGLQRRAACTSFRQAAVNRVRSTGLSPEIKR